MKKDVILTDCFNTLLCRRKTPNDVVYDWAVKMNGAFPHIPAADFYAFFKKSEKVLGEKNTLERGEAEYTFEEMMRFVYGIVGGYRLTDLPFADFYDTAYRRYYDAEHESHYLNKRIVNYLKKKKQQGCKVYVVSDFYCGGQTVDNWLRDADDTGGGTSFLDGIFVSCEYRLSKRSGALYRRVLEQLDVAPNRVKMVGDNISSDFFHALKNGISVKKVPPQVRADCRAVRQLKHKIEVPQAYREIFDLHCERYAYSNYAFPLYVFTKRLAEMCREKGVKNLFFFSREGKFLKVLFDKYRDLHHLDVATHYFVMSRAAVMTVSCQPLEEEHFRLILRSPFVSPKNFLISLGFDEEIKDILQDARVKHGGIPYWHLGKSKAYKRIRESKVFAEQYEKRRENQRKAFQMYLDSFGVDYRKEGLHFVDVGWNGSAQSRIFKYLEGQVQVEGYYLGLVLKDVALGENKKYGLLYSKQLQYKDKEILMYRHRRFNYEQILRASDGCCIGYDTEKAGALFDDKVNETGVYEKYISVWQDMISDKFDKIAAYDAEHFCHMDAVALKLFYEMTKRTTRTDDKMFLEVQNQHYDAFIRVGFTMRMNKGVKGLLYKLSDWRFLAKFGRYIKSKRIWY